MFMGTGFNVNTIFKENICGPQYILTLICGICEMMETACARAMFFRTGQIIGLVVHRKPTPTDPAIVELDHFCDPAAKAGFHKSSKFFNIGCQEVQVIQAPGRGTASVIALSNIF